MGKFTLNMLGVEKVLEPLNNMLGQFASYFPNTVAAGVIGFVGYFIAKILSEGIGFASDAIERFSGEMGVSGGKINFTKILKQLIFLFVFIPILIIALDALKIEVISRPAKAMLSSIFGAIPNILAAAAIIAVFYIAGRYVTTILKDLLKNVGADELSVKLNLSGYLGKKGSLSGILANITFFFLLFAGAISATEKLEMYQLTEILAEIIGLSGRIFLGLVILVLGNYISNFAFKTIMNSNNNKFLAMIARVATLTLFLAISLRFIGIADDIVNLGFGIAFGAIAIAFALAFGLGGRETAGKEMEQFVKKLRNIQDDKV